MDLHLWLDKQKGRARDLSLHLGVSKTAVSLWRANGIPLQHMPKIVEFTKGAVSIEDMAMRAIELRAANASKAESEAA